jgi:putative drug exporter of the RND superfamily
MERVGGVARLVCGRWTKWAVVGLWVILLAVAAPLAGQLSSAQKNDTAEWLPGDAEATQVFELQKKFQTTETSPAIVVYERPDGVTAADETAVAEHARELSGVDGVAGDIVGPITAEDGKALQLVVPVDMTGDGWNKSFDRVTEMREIVGSAPDGLTAQVAGPVGISADQAGAFGDADMTLMFAAMLIVIAILLFAYRSPTLWVLPIMAAGMSLMVSQGLIYLLAKGDVVTVNGQSTSVLMVLVLGAGTDYALLLIARYREELRKQQDRHLAMAVALRRATPAIVASAVTIAIGMLCLTVAAMDSTAGLGPVVAIGVVVALVAMVTLLPALLVIFGRWIFWPSKPKFGTVDAKAEGGRWAKLGTGISKRPRLIWIGTAVVLGAFALGMTQLNSNGLAIADSFVSTPESVVGQETLGRHFAGSEGQPVVVIGNEDRAGDLRAALENTDGVVDVSDPTTADGLVQFEGTLRGQPDSAAAKESVLALREAVHGIEGADAKVGGPTALTIDLNDANSHDNRLIIPLVLIAVLIVLVVLLRSLVAPLVLIATVVLSFAAALGASVLVFEHVFGFNGTDSAFPLFVFVWLVALGIDYNIFLMTRVREEALTHGTRRGALIGLTTTGKVITSAGLVLAGTFAALATMPLVLFAQLGFAVALGVLIDTFIVRSVLVTALTLDIGRHMWWPSKLAAKRDVPVTRETSEAKQPELIG